MVGKLASNIKFYLTVFAGLILLSATSCNQYSEMEAEEVEILYKDSGDSNLLPLVCEKYQGLMITPKEFDDLVYISKMTLNYCKMSYDVSKNSKEAGYLADYYFKIIEEQPTEILNLLMWLKLSGATDAMDNFVNADSKFFAIWESFNGACSDLLNKKTDKEIISSLKAMNVLCAKYIKDLNDINKLSVFKAYKTKLAATIYSIKDDCSNLITAIGSNNSKNIDIGLETFTMHIKDMKDIFKKLYILLYGDSDKDILFVLADDIQNFTFKKESHIKCYKDYYLNASK